jgi:tRNA (mo5U34)-methyltransferase
MTPMKYGSIPAGGLGTRLQPIGFSKELAPVGRRAVIEYLIERMLLAGVDKIFINTAEDKTDLIRYLATKSPYRDSLVFLVRERKGLLDGIVIPEQFLREDDELYFGLPDTIWYPKDGFSTVRDVPGELVLGLFDTGTPERFDSVVVDKDGKIQSIEVKVPQPKSQWTWAMGKMTVRAARRLRQYEAAQSKTPLFGDMMHLYAQDHTAYAIELPGSSCLDIGIPDDYEQAEAFVKQYEK